MPRTAEKITITMLLHIPKYSATVSAWTSTWVNQKGYVTCSYNATHNGENHYHDYVTYPEVLSNCKCMDFNLGEPERICNMFLQCHARRKKSLSRFCCISRSTQQLYVHGLQPG